MFLSQIVQKLIYLNNRLKCPRLKLEKNESRLFSKYENAHEVQRQWKHYFNMSPPVLPTITAVNQRFNKTGSVGDVPGTGRPTSFNREEDLRHGGYQSTVIGLTRLISSTSRYHAAMQRLPYDPTLIVNLNEDDFDRCSQSSEICLEKFNYDPALLVHIL